MDELKESAAHCGMEDEEQVELCIGGFIGVLKKSENFDDSNVDKIIETIGAEEAVKAYEKVEFRKGLPKPNPIIMALPKPMPGPPPVMILSAVAKGIRRKKREDKDVMHTEDAIKNLKGWKLKEEVIVKFMEVFVVFVEEKNQMDISEILCLPEE